MMDLENQEDGQDFSNPEAAFKRLMKIVETLRSENGCPWDKKQNPKSMRPCILEEAYECVDAITESDSENSKEELGDLFFNTLLAGYMFQQDRNFTVAEILNSVSDKILRRHPHVQFEDWLFSDGLHRERVEVDSVDEVNSQWNKIKDGVEGRKKQRILDQVPSGFPPMLKAYKYLKKASSQGFEWPDLCAAKSKILEELDEVEEAQKESSADHLEEEVGDLILSVVNYARLLKINPDVALERANKKFYKRYSYVEKRMQEENLPPDSSSLEKMEKFWNDAKQAEVNKNPSC